MLECPQCGRQFASDVKECPEDGTVLRADPTVAADIPVDPLVGRTFDEKYRLDSRLGEGGMGTVYRATHLLIERPVAVKVLNPRLVTDESARERFRREARAAGRLQHSNAVAVTDFGETRDGLVYIVMELLEGRPLREVMAREAPLDPARAVSLMLQAAAAVAAAHDAGVIHRDLKPGNIFVVQRPNAPHIVKVLDFGIAKLGSDTTDGVNPINTLTGAGVMIGTPRYMSPEQCDGAQLTPSSDVYSLGVILYEMLTGQTPFTGATPLALALKHSSEPPRSLREHVATIPPALEEVVLRALAKDPLERPQDAGEFRRELYYVAERLGLEHSAGFSAPTIESLRDAGTETPSGRLVIDIERLRSNRATAQTSEAVISDTAEGDVINTGGRPGGRNSSAHAARPESSSAAPSSTSRAAAHDAQPREPRRALFGLPLGGDARAWKNWLTEPPILVALICLAVLLLAGTLALWRSSERGAEGGAAQADEADDDVGRALAPSDQAPRARSFPQPRTVAEFYENGAYYISIHSYDAAIRDLRRAVELQPTHPSAHNRLGRALLLKGQYEDAEKSFRTAIKQRGGNYSQAQYNLGFSLQLQGKTDEAVSAYKEAIESRKGKYADAYYQIGSLFLVIPGRSGEAVEPLRKAIEQNDGRDPEAHFKLGAALAQQKDYPNAEAALREAINQRGGDFAFAHYNLGLLYETTGRVPEAIQEYEAYLAQSPRDEENRENRRRVENTLRDLRRRAAREGNQPQEGNPQR
jgi:serine/threonine-protein kinase